MKRLFYFLLVLLPALIVAALLFFGYAKIDTAMSSLLPQNLAENPVFQAVENAQNRRLNETAVILVGAENPQQAFENASKIADLWRQSGLFYQVENTLQININDLSLINQQMGVALLPDYQAELLLHNPDEYFQEYAQDLLNPFSGSLISPSEDWLGFSRFLSQKQGVNQLNWSAEYNALYSEYENKTWVWVRAVPNKKAIAQIPQLLQETKNLAQKQGIEIAVSGGIFFAADSKQKAEQESKIMSAVGLTLTFAFLLWAFRTPRILALSVVLVAGISTGLAVSLAVFSTVHILTIVVGTSLVGVLVDFPLHGLSASLFRQPENKWHTQNSIRKLLPTFAISLCITAAGYLMLLIAPLTLLKQTAVFSVAALFGAFLTTLFLLPEFLHHYQPRTTHFTHLANFLSNNINRLPLLWISLICGVFLALGIAKSHWQDDIRQWVVLPDDLLQQTVKVAQISGIEQNAQNLIIQADSEDKLLNLSKNIAHQIQPFADTQGLHEWILSTQKQQQIKQHLLDLSKQGKSFDAMTAVGIRPEIMEQAMRDTAQKPDINLSGSLKTR
ncbi:MAG: MMPL family transporter [Neisseriaceae bacterium]|nr:MMPL family transporter [Neisseriaceae bacterium]